MGEDELERLGAEVEGLVDLLELRLVLDEVGKAFVRDDLRAVEVEREAGVEIGVHLEAAHHVVFAEAELPEDRGVGKELHERAVALARVLALAAVLLLEDALLEERVGVFAVAHGAHVETVRKRVHGLCADAVHADGELEALGVELAARVEFAHAVHDLAERDAAPEVADRARAGVPVEPDLHAAAEAHDELVDRVVDDLLQEHVDAVVVVAAVARAADVHAEPPTDVLHRVEVLDVVVVVFCRCHANLPRP